MIYIYKIIYPLICEEQIAGVKCRNLGTTWKNAEKILRNLVGTLDVNNFGWCKWRERIISRCIFKVYTPMHVNGLDVKYEKKREERNCFKTVSWRPLKMEFSFTKMQKTM